MDPDKCTFKRILWQEHSEHESQADKENKVQNTKKMSAFNPLIQVMESNCQSYIQAAVSKKNELLCPVKCNQVNLSARKFLAHRILLDSSGRLPKGTEKEEWEEDEVLATALAVSS